MSKDFLYGVIAVCTALILLIGAYMAMPEKSDVRQTEPTQTVAMTSQPAATVPATEKTEPPTQITEPVAAPTTPATKATEPAQPSLPSTEPTETEPVAATAAPPTEETVWEETVLTFVTWPARIYPGKEGTVTVQGKPDTQYTIQVYYASGVSQAKGLDPQYSDSDGFATWTWKVSKNVKPGTYKIVVTGGGETQEVSFTIMEQ